MKYTYVKKMFFVILFTFLVNQSYAESSTLNLSDSRVKLTRDALSSLLSKQELNKIQDYFTDDAVMIINDKVLSRKEIDKRISWIAQHNQSVKLKFYAIIFNGNEGFDYHTTEVTDLNGKCSTYKVFGYIQLKGHKISRYEDVTIQIAGENSMQAVSATTDNR